jgi:hypothetical protein
MKWFRAAALSEEEKVSPSVNMVGLLGKKLRKNFEKLSRHAELHGENFCLFPNSDGARAALLNPGFTCLP